MYIDLKKFLKEINLAIKGVIHVGAHKGEELNLYKSLKIKNVILFEPNPSLIKILNIKKNIYNFFFNMNINVIEKAISDICGDLKLNITSNSQSSSILNLKEHKILYPKITKTSELIVQSSTLDNEFHLKNNIEHFNMLNMDIQGAELLVLKGSRKIINHLDLIYTEINFKEMYENCVLADELDAFLYEFNFQRVLTSTPESDCWGDAIYIRKKS